MNELEQKINEGVRLLESRAHAEKAAREAQERANEQRQAKALLRSTCAGSRGPR